MLVGWALNQLGVDTNRLPCRITELDWGIHPKRSAISGTESFVPLAHDRVRK
jgi:hypothetical protein